MSGHQGFQPVGIGQAALQAGLILLLGTRLHVKQLQGGLGPRRRRFFSSCAASLTKARCCRKERSRSLKNAFESMRERGQLGGGAG